MTFLGKITYYPKKSYIVEPRLISDTKYHKQSSVFAHGMGHLCFLGVVSEGMTN